MKKVKNDGTSLNSDLIRKPIARMFPIFLLPMVASFCVGFVYPFFKGLYLSFCKFKTTSDAKILWADGKLNGINFFEKLKIIFGNYIKAFNDESFIYSFKYTTIYTIVSVVLINVLAFMIAYFLTQKIKGANIFRTVFFMPNLIGGVVLGYIWSMIFDGILRRYSTSILLDTKLGFWGLIILMLWQQIGYMMIIYIAGIQAVPEDMIEAAKIDGASRSKTLFKVIIPNVMPSITICMFLSLTNGFKLFDQNLVLNGGQPFDIYPDGTMVHTTEMIALNIYRTFYGENAAARGTAQAKAVLFFILVSAIGLIQIRATRKKEVQQ